MTVEMAWLSGAELDGISVWRDANSSGIADPGEVVPVEDLGIAHEPHFASRDGKSTRKAFNDNANETS